jgi:hypothetical protein
MASAVPEAAVFKVSVEFECREDGGLRAYSKDVPGFVLSNRDCDVVLAGVVPVLETILSEMFNGRVRVKQLMDVRDRLEDAGVIDPMLPRRRKAAMARPVAPIKREYVTELAA